MARRFVTNDAAYTVLDRGLFIDDAGVDCCCGSEDCYYVAERCACNDTGPFTAYVPCDVVQAHPNFPGTIVFQCEGTCYFVSGGSPTVQTCFDPCCDLIPEFDSCEGGDDPCCGDCDECAGCCYGNRDRLFLQVVSQAHEGCSKPYRGPFGSPPGTTCRCCRTADACATGDVTYIYVGGPEPPCNETCDVCRIEDECCIRFMRDEANFPFGWDPLAPCNLYDDDSCYDPSADYSCPECGDSWPQMMTRCCTTGEWYPEWYPAASSPGQSDCSPPCCARLRVAPSEPCPPCQCEAVSLGTCSQVFLDLERCSRGSIPPTGCDGEQSYVSCCRFLRPLSAQEAQQIGPLTTPQECCERYSVPYTKILSFCVSRKTCCTGPGGACVERRPGVPCQDSSSPCDDGSGSGGTLPGSPQVPSGTGSGAGPGTGSGDPRFDANPCRTIGLPTGA